MSLESLGVRRRVRTEASNLSDVYMDWPNCIQNYKCDAIAYVWSGEFVKTHAIQALYQDIQRHGPTPEQGELLKALLTDQGLLFPQTRERSYDAHHSMRSSLLTSAAQHEAANKIFSSSGDQLERLLALGRKCYTKGRDKFYEFHEECIPFITLENALAGIKTLVSDREGPFSIHETSKKHELGYRSKEMTTQKKINDLASLEVYVSQWIDHVIFTWEGGENSLSSKNLRQILDWPTIELYELLAFVLRDCFQKDAHYREWSNAQYTPALNANQLKAFDKQLFNFRKETLSKWKIAYPVLAKYLHPDLTPFINCDIDTFAIGLDAPSEDKHCKKLTEAFWAYSCRMESVRSNKSVKERMFKMAEWFLSFRAKETSSSDRDEHFLFLDRPDLIFGIFRSPVHRYIINSEDRCWKIHRTIEDACVNLPLPITNQSLDTDTALFRTTVDICADRCSQDHIPFQKSAWNALWDCIVQCVQCLPFQSGDLFSMRNGFIHTLYLGDKGAPVSDRWIEEKLTSVAPNYIPIWRAYIKKWCSPSRKRNKQWQQAVNTFRSLFENVSVNSDKILEHLDFLCSQTGWSNVSILPSPEDLYSIDKDVSRRGYAAAIREGQRVLQTPLRSQVDETEEACIEHKEAEVQWREQLSEDKKRVQLGWKRLWMEWLLLQCVCDQARRELMEAVYLYLTKTAKDQA